MEKLHPKSIWLFFFSFLARGLVIFIFLSFWAGPFFAVIIGITGRENMLGYFLSLLGSWFIVFSLYVIFCYIVARLTYKYWRYELGEDAFKKESGIIWKKYVSIPYEKFKTLIFIAAYLPEYWDFQIFRFKQQVHRRFLMGGRLAGVGAEGRLPGVDKVTAEKLRDELIKRAKQSKQSI